ncbi:hypothetical protein Bca52824_040438 [Brassica carinata]|uniref:Translation initiation factor 3 N-terminal domain-containing protein n=1 Tax=Brassica carinata TaxID=52824 RepID=A0A8X7RXT2_BRACI|nr:hypothetical protein Bca52824_040438 [Brassica carinata]
MYITSKKEEDVESDGPRLNDKITSETTSKKEEDVESDGPRLNDKITSETVRLVSEEEHCIMTLKEALRRAKELKHDLVEVQRDAKPPVCKIVDYAHDKYKKDQVGKERAKAKRAEVTIRPEVKEIHFIPKITSKKEEDVESDGKRLNDKITSETVRLVSEEGHCIMTLKEALRRAKELKHDLVEVQRDAQPPVCKIVDYAHDKYKKDQVGKERAKAKRAEVTIRPEVKETHFTPKIVCFS